MFLSDKFRHSLVCIDLDPEIEHLVKKLIDYHNVTCDSLEVILSFIIDSVLLGDEVATILDLSERIMEESEPVGNLDPDAVFIITDSLRRLFDSVDKTFKMLGVKQYGIPPYELLNYDGYKRIILRKAENIDH
jgi:hypothetical protein